MRTVLICGGRDFMDSTRLFHTMWVLHEKHQFDKVIHGAARGADTLGASWGRAAGLPVQAYPANWDRDGKSAGPIRNQRMLDEGKPDLVVAFPGGRGTADMVRRARAAGVGVVEFT